MIRDRIKTEEYFQEAFEWYSKCQQEALERFDKVKPENLSSHFQFRVIDYENLLKVGYSLGKDVQELFPYYQGILSSLKKVASEGVSFYRAVDVFALEVLYSDEDTVVTRRFALALERCGQAEGLSSTDYSDRKSVV